MRDCVTVHHRSGLVPERRVSLWSDISIGGVLSYRNIHCTNSCNDKIIIIIIIIKGIESIVYGSEYL